MLPILLLILAAIFSAVQIYRQEAWKEKRIAEILLKYLLLFSVGIMGLLAFYAHIFMADETARQIGWPTGSPFQFEMGITNLSYGVLGVLCLFFRRLFWLATGLGYSILLLGCMVGHLIQYGKGDTAPLNIGVSIWVMDLVVPILLLSLLACLVYRKPYDYR